MMMETVISRSIRVMFSGSLVVGLGFLTQTVLAEENAQRVEITGSSIKRVDAETALPVTIMKREDIERSGAITAQDLMALIPSNFGGNVLANNVGATGVASAAALRGLPSKYTLVLLNGRRIANYALGQNQPVDLNSIPLSAIDRVEILRDGASAIYGADAVAGVVNFILRKDYQGAEASIYGTNVAAGGGDSRSYNFTGGYGDLKTQRFNFLLSVNHENDDALKAKDRSFSSTAVIPSLGINKASPRNGVPNLNFTDTLGNKYTGINPYRHLDCNNPEFALVVINATQCGTDYVKYIDLIPKATHDNVVARAVFQVNDDHQLYAEAAHTKDDITASYSPAPYTVPMVYPTSGRFYPASITLPKGMTLKAGYKMPDSSILTANTVLTSDLVVTPTGSITGTWRTVAGGGRTDLTSVSNDRLLLGAKGELSGWDYDTALTYSRNDGTTSFGPGQFSYSQLTPLVNSGQINVFGSQDAISLAALNSALLTGKEQSAVSTSKEVDLRVSKEIAHWTYGPVGLAFGGSARKEDLDQTSYPVLASGDQVGGAGPIPSVTGGRKVYALFSEASIPLYKDLEMQLAARYDKYKNDFGTGFSNISPKVALRYQPTKTVLFRGSYAEGYRAPTLYENLRPFTSGNNTGANWSDPIRCPGGTPINSVNAVGEIQDECNVQLPSATSGNTDLKPEKSKQFSLGIVFSPTRNFNGSLDYFDIKISDAIQQQSEIQVFNDPTGNVNNFYRYDPTLYPNGWTDDGHQTGAIKGSTNPNFPLAYVNLPYFNTAEFFAQGFDLSLNYKYKVERIGTLGVDLEGTYFTKHGYKYAGSDAVSDLGAYKDFAATPRWRHALTFTYATGPWNASMTHNYTAGYHDFVGSETVSATYPADRRVSSYTTVDGQVGWKGIKNLELVFGIKNIFDQDPPLSRNELNFQTGYDATFTNPLGRTYYLRAKYKFL